MSEKETERERGSSKEPAPTLKLPYVAPQLLEYGHLADLTQGATFTPDSDAAGGFGSGA